MKICQITNAFSLEKITPPRKIGGAEACAERISRSLLLKGHQVIVITQRPFEGLRSLLPRKETKEGLTIYSFYPLNVFSIYHTHKKSLIAKGLWRIIDALNPLPALYVYWIVRKERPDVIHSHILHGFSPFFLLAFLKRARIPLVQTLHSYGYLCLRCNLLNAAHLPCSALPLPCRVLLIISRFFVDSIPGIVISPSEFCLRLYRQYGFFKKSRQMVLPNGIETNAANPHSSANEAFRILYAGRLVPEKGVETLIAAVRSLGSAHVRLTIVGEGSSQPLLETLAAQDARIRFAGKISWEQLKKLYAEHDITVVPSIYYEILGLVVLESMTCGTPVIGSRIGGITELIRDGYNGYLFEPGDSRGLSAVIERLHNNPALTKTLGEQAFAYARAFDITNHTSELEKIYASCLTIP